MRRTLPLGEYLRPFPARIFPPGPLPLFNYGTAWPLRFQASPKAFEQYVAKNYGPLVCDTLR